MAESVRSSVAGSDRQPRHQKVSGRQRSTRRLVHERLLQTRRENMELHQSAEIDRST